MSLLEPVLNERFMVRVQSFDSGNPSQKWSNNYTLINAEGGFYSDLTDAVTSLLDFQQGVTYQPIITERGVVSTFVSDSNPYEGDEFTAVEFNGNGDLSATSESRIPLEVALFLRKNTLTGRTGKLFIRGALQESEVQFGQSLFALTSPSGITTKVNTAIISSQLDALFPGGASPFKLCLVSTSNVGFNVRSVQDLSVSGVRMVNMNKRYYNRG